jgi:hypothetical protein
LSSIYLLISLSFLRVFCAQILRDAVNKLTKKAKTHLMLTVGRTVGRTRPRCTNCSPDAQALNLVLYSHLLRTAEREGSAGSIEMARGGAGT